MYLFGVGQHRASQGSTVWAHAPWLPSPPLLIQLKIPVPAEPPAGMFPEKQQQQQQQGAPAPAGAAPAAAGGRGKGAAQGGKGAAAHEHAVHVERRTFAR